MRFARACGTKQNIIMFLPYIILTIFFLANLYLFWPGQLFPDSINQYKMAITGIYSDGNPPMMSVLWKLLNFFYPGPGLILFFHLLLLYSATALFMTIFWRSRLRWLYLLLPLIPPISIYSSMIWKDLSFTFSYLLAGALISFFMIKHRRPSWLATMTILALLFYGTGVKFQAQYVLPVFLLGFWYLFTNFMLTRRTTLFALLSYMTFLAGLATFNNTLVPPENKSHMWQHVKLYDLAAISVDTNEDLLPTFITNRPDFSLRSIEEKLNYERVDDLLNTQNAPLTVGHTPEERALVWQAWFNAVKQHPWSYIKHRFLLWWTMLNNYPIQRLATLDFSGYGGLTWFVELQKNSQDNQQSLKQTMRDWVGKFFITALRIIRYPLKTIFIVPFLIFYLILGLIAQCRARRYAPPLIMLSSAGLLLLAILFFFTMASSLRYVYFTICMFHACHGFAYMCSRRS